MSILINKPYALTRYAPTPSGYLHIGNVLSFVLTATIAQKSSARILLRIDDLDRDRVRDEYLQDIFDTLSFLGLPYDEGPRNVDEFKSSWSQMHRMDRYKDALDELADGGAVFACQCSRLQLQQVGAVYPQTCRNVGLPLSAADTSWRSITDEQMQLPVNTWPSGTDLARLPDEMQSFVVRKKDGYPAYQLASVIDDTHFGVDLVVRGEDLWPSTLAQLYLAQQLNVGQFKNTAFFHHPLIMAADGNKLSKSAGDTSVRYLRDNGYEAADVLTLIASVLGWKRAVSDWQVLGELLYNRLLG